MRQAGTGSSGRSAGIDMLRGALVLAVIAGHCAELADRGSFLAWVGAGVRMPLFIGLTGYLFNLERARAAPVTVLLRRYYPRLILPWLVASVVYLALSQPIQPLALALLFLRPSFHLWFVPVMLAFMIAATVSRRPPAILLACVVLPSIAAMYWLGVGHTGMTPAWMPDRRFFIYPIFFFYGLWVAERSPERARVGAAMVLAPIGFLWWCGLHDAPSLRGEVAAVLIWCLPLIYLLPYIRDIRREAGWLASIGRDSLYYYLWHPLVFAAWAGLGLDGLAMLAASIATLILLRLGLSRPGMGGIAMIFGVAPRTGWRADDTRTAIVSQGATT